MFVLLYPERVPSHSCVTVMVFSTLALSVNTAKEERNIANRTENLLKKQLVGRVPVCYITRVQSRISYMNKRTQKVIVV